MPSSNDAPDPAAAIQSVRRYFKGLQDDICRQLGELEPAADFTEDAWAHKHGGGGITRVIEQGAVFEKGGVNFSHIKGAALPASATDHRARIKGNLLKRRLLRRRESRW